MRAQYACAPIDLGGRTTLCFVLLLIVPLQDQKESITIPRNEGGQGVAKVTGFPLFAYWFSSPALAHRFGCERAYFPLLRSYIPEEDAIPKSRISFPLFPNCLQSSVLNPHPSLCLLQLLVLDASGSSWHDNVCQPHTCRCCRYPGSKAATH